METVNGIMQGLVELQIVRAKIAIETGWKNKYLIVIIEHRDETTSHFKFLKLDTAQQLASDETKICLQGTEADRGRITEILGNVEKIIAQEIATKRND